MKTRLFFLAAPLLLVLLSANGTSLARQNQQEGRKAKVQQPSDQEAAAGPDVVDGKFNKTLPVVLSLKNCSGSVVELNGTCHIEGSIESTQDSRFSVALEAHINLTGNDDSANVPYKVSFVRQIKNQLNQSNFDVIYYQNPSDGENVKAFTIRLKFEGSVISLVSVKAIGCFKEG